MIAERDTLCWLWAATVEGAQHDCQKGYTFAFRSMCFVGSTEQQGEEGAGEHLTQVSPAV